MPHCAVRRIRVPADRGVRRRRPHDRSRASPGMPAERTADREVGATPARGAACPLAARRDHAARRVTFAHRRCCASAAPIGWTTSSASRPPRRCASISRCWNRARRHGAPSPVGKSSAGSRNSTTVPQAGTVSSVSSPASRLDRTVSIHASLPPTWPADRRARSTRMSTAHAGGQKIISRRGRHIWRRIARRVAGQVPTRCGCFCTSARIG